MPEINPFQHGDRVKVIDAAHPAHDRTGTVTTWFAAGERVRTVDDLRFVILLETGQQATLPASGLEKLP